MIVDRMRHLLNNTTSPATKRKLLGIRDRALDYYARSTKSLGQRGPLPDYLIIGAQKCGTTFLYDELTRHPQVVPAITKEVHYFDSNYDRGLRWYRSFFASALWRAAGSSSTRQITGEASPCYIFHPHGAARIASVLPDARLIVLLRDPVNRAYSQYQHEVRLGFESLSFEEAIAREQDRLLGEREKMLADEHYEGFNYMHHSYLARGIYVDQLREWMARFPREQLLILQAEEFFQDSRAIVNQVIQFLELDPWEPAEEGTPKQFKYSSMNQETREWLTDYFRPHNERLYEYLGVDFGWSR